MISRRTALTAGIAGLSGLARVGHAAAADDSSSELRIGNTMAYSGPESLYGAIGQLEAAFFKRINTEGGIAGSTIKFISLDDGFHPSQTVQDVHRLIENDKADFLFNTLGTSTNVAIARYVNQKKIPQLFVASGADQLGDYKRYPWTIGLQPSYRVEAQIYAEYALRKQPDAKFALLYQNSEFGRNYLQGLRDIVGPDWNRRVAKVAFYETTQPTVYSQLTALKNSGANVLICAATPRQAVQAISTVHDMGWHPLFFMTNVSISADRVMQRAGARKGIGIITSGWLKDNADPTWQDDLHMNEWRQFMSKWMPGADLNDSSYIYAYTACRVLLHVLVNCDGDFSHENVMSQATNIQRLHVPTLLPGITVSTSPTNHHPVRAMQLQQWSGRHWVRFGDIVEGIGGRDVASSG